METKILVSKFVALSIRRIERPSSGNRRSREVEEIKDVKDESIESPRKGRELG